MSRYIFFVTATILTAYLSTPTDAEIVKLLSSAYTPASRGFVSCVVGKFAGRDSDGKSGWGKGKRRFGFESGGRMLKSGRNFSF